MLNHKITGSSEKQIIFLHGNSQSLKVWESLTSMGSLKEKHTLITVDLPGHGNSFRSDNPEKDYSLFGLADHFLSFIKQFDSKPYILVGNSLGSNIISEIAPKLKNCSGVLFTGSCVFGKSVSLEEVFLPNPNATTCFTENPTDDMINMLAEDTIYNQSSDTKNLISNEFKNTDTKVRAVLGACIAGQQYSDELLNLEKSGIETAFVFGAEEKICNPHYLDHVNFSKWRSQSVLIENCGHFPHLDQPKALANIISEFAADCFNKISISTSTP